MRPENRQFWLATTTLVGTIIGVGVFGIPYAFSRVGLAVAIAYIVILGGIQLLQHLFYAEAAIACPEPLRLAGLTGKYLGRRAKTAAMVSTVLGFWGGMLAYMLVGGTFLHVLLSPLIGGSEFVYQVAWSLAGAALIYFSLDFVVRVNMIATVGLLGSMGLIFAMGLPHVRLANLPLLGVTDWFLPYGVVLFSLSGLPAILEMEDILRGRHEKYRPAIIVGTVAAAVLTAAFGLIVWGVTGTATTSDAVSGLRVRLGPGITVVAAVFGFLAVATSFFATSLNLLNTFQFDYKLKRPVAWLLTGGPPFAIFLLGAKDFISVISFSGAVFGGITAALVALLYIAVTKHGEVKEKRLGIPVSVAYLTIAVLSAGALYEAGTTAMAMMRP